jgi:hypothetical protein
MSDFEIAGISQQNGIVWFRRATMLGRLPIYLWISLFLTYPMYGCTPAKVLPPTPPPVMEGGRCFDLREIQGSYVVTSVTVEPPFDVTFIFLPDDPAIKDFTRTKFVARFYTSVPQLKSSYRGEFSSIRGPCPSRPILVIDGINIFSG